MKKMNNKGFSLVELIIVIAIMAVLIGVMAPQFLRYVEQSRRSTDISNAQSIATAIQADIADATLDHSNTTGSTVAASWISSLNEDPKVRGTVATNGSIHAVAAGGDFTATWNIVTGSVSVYVGTTSGYELYPGTSATNGADVYKKAEK